MSWGRPPKDPNPFPADGPGEGPVPSPWVDPDGDFDFAALEGAFAQRAAAAGQRFSAQLQVLLSRRVPVRGLEHGPVGGVARMRWGDGTVMLVTAARPGELSRVLRTLSTRRSMTLAAYELDEAGLLLSLRGATGRQPVRLLVVGPDQPD